MHTHIINTQQVSRGFSLLELMIVLAIIAAVSAVGVGSYRNFGKNVELTTTAHTIASDLKLMQSKSMIGEGGYKWGVHFVNDTADYYELFSTPTNYADPAKVVMSTTTLPKGIEFSVPAGGSGTSVLLSWNNSVSSDFSNVVILRKVSSSITDTPADGSSPAVSDTIGSSIVVYTGTGTTFTDSSVSAGTTYYYKIFTKDTRGNYDASAVGLGPFTP